MVDDEHRTKITLVWDKEDVLKIFSDLMEECDCPKLMEMPSGHYSLHPYDKVMANGELVGLSTYPIYSSNERTWLSLATLDKSVSAHESKVSIIWGGENGGTKKQAVERHR